MKIIKNHLLFIFISILPLTIIVGPSVSLIAILLTASIFILILLKFEVSKIYTNKVCVALFALYMYLIFNTLISIDPFSGIYRNLGFLRFLLLFLAINYFFYAKSNADNIFIFWSIIFSIFVFDVFVERFSGANILGFKAQSVHEESFSRVVSFFKDEAIAGAHGEVGRRLDVIPLLLQEGIEPARGGPGSRGLPSAAGRAELG